MSVVFRRTPLSVSKQGQLGQIGRLGRGFHSYMDWPMLKEEHKAVAEMCRNFAEQELMPIAAKCDKGMHTHTYIET